MALAVRAAQLGRRHALVLCLALTALFGAAFLGLKAVEYYEDYRDNLVPGVAFDEQCHRLGYGGGFYDVFLRAAGSVPRVGICFDVQVVDAIPIEDHDEPVDVVVTEERAIRRRRLE